MLNLLTTAALAGALCVAPPSDPSDPADEALVAVVHDLRGLGPETTHDHVELPLLPLVGAEIEVSGSLHDVDESWREWAYELLVDVLFADEFQYEGRLLDYRGDSLSVIAPAPVQADVKRLLEAFRQVSRRAASVRLESFALVPGRMLPADLDRADLDTLVSQGVLSRLPVRRERVRLGQPVLREQLVHHDMLRGWEVEIAQRAVALASSVQRVETGVRTLLWAEADGLRGMGCRLGVADLRSALSSIERRSFDPQDEVMLESGTRELSYERLLDLHHISATDLVGEAWLAPGDSFVMAASTRTAEGSTGVVLRVVLEALDAVPQPLTFGDQQVQLLDLSSLTRSDRSLPAIRSGQLRGEYEGETSENGYRDWCLPTLHRDADDQEFDDGVRRLLEAFDWNTEGRVFENNVRWAVVCGDSEDVAQLVTDLGALDAPVAGRALHWRLVDGDGAAVSSGVLSLVREDALAVVGESLAVLRGVEVEVATSAVAEEPVVCDLFDGCWLRARSAGPDEVLLTLAGNRVVARDGSAPGRGMEGLLDQLTMTSCDLTVSVPADGALHEVAQLADGLRLLGRVTSR